MKEVWKGIGPLNELVIIHNQRILTMEVAISLYGWPLLDSTALCLCWISNGFTCLVKSQPYSDTYPCKVSDVTNKLLRRGPISFLLLWCISFSKKWANPDFFFIYFWFFQTNIITIFTYNKYMWKMSIQYTVPGFELTTFWLWVTSFYHLTRAPTNFLRFFTLPITG